MKSGALVEADRSSSTRSMAQQRWSFLKSPGVKWLVAVLVVLDASLVHMLIKDVQADAERARQLRVARLKEAAKPKVPPPPAMLRPPPVADMLQSGTLIVISKKSQNMFVFSDGLLWATTPVSTGKRRHETPSGVFPVIQKQRYHRSNIYSGAPMPFMQRLTWEGIALHAGRVPRYAASHGCIRMPHAFAAALFKLTNMTKTTVVIGDDPLETEVHAQQFALSTSLQVHAQLAPPPEPPKVKAPDVQLAGAGVPRQPIPPAQTTLADTAPPVSPPPASHPPPAPVLPPPSMPGGQTIQLTAAPSQAEAEAYWSNLRAKRPDISRFAKSVEAATVKSRQVYRLRISGADAYSYCAKLQSEGIGCLNVS